MYLATDETKATRAVAPSKNKRKGEDNVSLGHLIVINGFNARHHSVPRTFNTQNNYHFDLATAETKATRAVAPSKNKRKGEDNVSLGHLIVINGFNARHHSVPRSFNTQNNYHFD